MAKLKHVDPTTTGLSWNGQNFEPDEAGNFEVPEEAVPELVSIGFLPAPPEEEGTGSMEDLAKLTKAEIIAHALTAYGATLDPADKKDALLEQVAQLAAKAADEAKD